jgi:hypothetical protein
MSGYGVITWRNGSTYMGDWKDNKKHGWYRKMMMEMMMMMMMIVMTMIMIMTIVMRIMIMFICL